MKLKDVFGVEKPIIGMLHLNGYGADEKMALAKKEIEIMYRNGVDAVLVENYFGGAEDVESALKYLHEHYPDKIYHCHHTFCYPFAAGCDAFCVGSAAAGTGTVMGHIDCQ